MRTTLFKRKTEVVKPIKIVFCQKGGIVSEYEFPKGNSEILSISFPRGREAQEVYLYFVEKE